MSTAPTSTWSKSQRMHAVTAGFLGWTLDAFDYFVVVFLLDVLAMEFGVSKKAMAFTLTATLLTRPLGALIFGLLADRFGRRLPFMANVIFFSVIEVLCGFASSYNFFLALRVLFGIGMGGEWGVGASLAMESAPSRWRGVLSGILQSGYAVGYLLASIASRFVLPALGWRWMFWIGGLPALLSLYIRTKVPESEAWKEHRAPTVGAIVKEAGKHWQQFLYLVLMMTLFVFLSHGTQDLYPDFLKTVHKIPAKTVSNIAILYNLGAIVGAILFGQLSQWVGRRRSILTALSLCLMIIPVWAFGWTPLVLTIGAILMQAGVQGAWGTVPAHLNEVSPGAVRGLVPGLAYQFGILFGAPTNNIQLRLADHLGYAWAIASFEIVTIVLLAVTVALGKEAKDKQFSSAAADA